MPQRENKSQGKKTQILLSVERNSSSPRQTAAAALQNKVIMSLGPTRSCLQGTGDRTSPEEDLSYRSKNEPGVY